MKAKILLTGLVAPIMFAACTQEETFVPQQEAGKIDLSNRPTLGKVTLGFDSQTRATLNEEGLFNSLLWEDGDAVGARIVDTPKLPAVPSFNRFFDYTVCDYASTNYKFEKGAGSVWQSEALMIEGNYMFYAPYDEAALYRDPLKMVFPIAQTINPESEQMEKANANTDAIKNFFEDNTTTTVVGYKFLSSKNPEKVVSPTMTHIYAYPQITLKNNYSIDEDSNPSTPAVAKPITIEKIVLSSANFKKNYKINQSALVNVLKEAYAKTEDVKANNKVVEKGNDKADAGAWTNATKMLQDGRTSTITTSSDATDITVTFDPALTIAAEGDFKFHVVLPAEAYTDLKATVYLAGSKSFVTGTTADKFAPAANLTYAPGKRYAKEEYNFEDGEYEIKDGTAGELATFTLQGTIGDYVAPVYIQTPDQLETYIAALNNNTKTVTEGKEFILQQKDGYAEMTINEAVVAIRNKYLSAGKMIFTSNMNVEGDITLDGNYEFQGKLNQKSGNLTLKSKVDGDATFNGTVTLDGATLGGTASFKAATITSADIKGAITFNGNATVKTLTTSTSATVKGGVVTIDKNSNAAMSIAIEGGEVVLNKANYDKNITVGTTKDNGTKADKAGTLTIGAENALTNVFFNNGTVNINTKVNGVGDSYFSKNWKFGTLKVNTNGTIDAAEFTNKAKVVNNGTILAKVNNPAGSIIENNATMTVSSNEGKIVVAEGSSTYVLAGSAAGEIDNTNKAALFLDGCSNTVTYTFSTQQTTEDIENFDAVLYGINKVIFNAGINFNKKFDDPTKVFYGVNEIDINGGTVAVAANLAMPVNAKVMNITGNVTIDGFKKDVSTLLISHANAMAGKEGTKINVAKNAVLTIKEITVGANKVGAEAEAKLMFNFAQPTVEEAKAGVKAGAIKIQNANLYYGAAGTAVSADALDANSSQESKYWNGTAWN